MRLLSLFDLFHKPQLEPMDILLRAKKLTETWDGLTIDQIFEKYGVKHSMYNFETWESCRNSFLDQVLKEVGGDSSVYSLFFSWWQQPVSIILHSKSFFDFSLSYRDDVKNLIVTLW